MIDTSCGYVNTFVRLKHYVPTAQILKNTDYCKENWKKYIERIGHLFKNRELPDMSTYDDGRYLKVERSTFSYGNEIDNFKALTYKVKNTGFSLSDHTSIESSGIFTWNIQHHYSYNGTNDYLDSNVIRDRGYKVLSEQVRYSLISTTIRDVLENEAYKCVALQECEYSVYKTVVDSLDNAKYTCRFIPHRISYDDEGLYVESFGCALILKGRDERGITHVNAIERKYYRKYETNYKYVIRIHNNVMYSSVHLPKLGKTDEYSSWVNFAFKDFEFILSKMDNSVSEGYIIGDLNMKRCVLDSFLLVFQDFNFRIIEENCVDYIIHVRKNVQFQPSSSLSYDVRF
jgi:hypothetical protein